MRFSKTGAVVAALLLVVGCGSDDDSTGTGGNTDGSVTASVDGTSFSGNLAVQGTLSSTVFGFGATQSSGVGAVKQLNVSIFPVSGTGTFTVGGITANIATYTETAGSTVKVWNTTATGGSGTVTITSFSTSQIKGTFDVYVGAVTSTGATGTKHLTGGGFTINLN